MLSSSMKTFLTKTKIFSFFNQLIFAYSIYSLMFVSNGLDIKQVGILLSTWSLTALILEVPLGFLADRYNRKHILALGILFKLIVFATWIIFPTFWGYLIGFVFWGISGALISGTFEAYIYDELVKYKQEKHYENILGKISSLKLLGVASALFLGGIISEIGYTLVLFLSILSCIIALVAILSTKSTKSIKSTGEKDIFKDIKTIIPSVLKNRNLLILSFVFILLMAAYGTMDEMYPLLYKQLEIQNRFIGILGMIMYLFASLGGWLMSFKKVSKRFNIHVVILAIIICYFGLAITNSIVFVILVFPLASIITMFETFVTARIQEGLTSSIRATSLSILNMLKELVGIGCMLLVGFVTDANIFNAFYIASILGILALSISLGYKKMVGCVG
jgi:MFS family permease